MNCPYHKRHKCPTVAILVRRLEILGLPPWRAWADQRARDTADRIKELETENETLPTGLLDSENQG